MKTITVSGREYEYDEESMRRCFDSWLEWSGSSESETCCFDWFVEAAHDHRSMTYVSVAIRHFREIWEAGRESMNA